MFYADNILYIKDGQNQFHLLSVFALKTNEISRRFLSKSSKNMLREWLFLEGMSSNFGGRVVMLGFVVQLIAVAMYDTPVRLR